MSKYTPYDYQAHAEQHIIENPYAGLFLEMGLGKTVITLTGIDKLINDLLEVTKVLVIAPKKVAESTWTTEASKWDHLQHLRISQVLGSESQRKRALQQQADIYVINRENVAWLVSYLGGAWPFDMMVIDELSSFKSAKSVRFKALRHIRPKTKRVVGLTGTPMPNSLLDLWPQLYLLDMGDRLGKTQTSYREKYFKPNQRNGHIVYNYKLDTPDKEILGEDIYVKEIFDKIGDICISMKAEDYLQLPARVDRMVPVKLSPETMKKYEDFEREQVMALQEELEDGKQITATNAAALTGKLLQFANGAIYDSEKAWHEMHREKLEALEEILDTATGPVLVFYWFKHDLERILPYLKAYKPRELKDNADISDWNKGKVKLLLAHPASAGHGLNLQAGGSTIVWFSLPNFSLELYQQANARLHRQGQINNVIIHHLIAAGTMDEDVMETLERKAGGQNALMNAVKARIAKYSAKGRAA